MPYCAVIVALIFIFNGNIAAANTSISYTYDQVGRIATAKYDNGACIVYSYDTNGNRTSQTITLSGAPATPIWGTGAWGCFNWTPQ
jgi:YD repeat-containing protein